jgi:phosphatidylserine/phosphatidylglycerophosphate/cardiolipin synthase-like enzyme
MTSFCRIRLQHWYGDFKLSPMAFRAAILLILFGLAACTTSTSQPPNATPVAHIVVLFSPTSVTGASIRDEIIRRIDATTRTLDVAMYTFNEPSLSEALIRAKGRGVALRVILDTAQAHQTNSQSDTLAAAGIPLKLMKGIRANGIMHHKMAIYDGSTVQTGSFNWTDNASCCSWENAVFLTDQPIVTRYQQEFERMWVRE